MAYNKKMKEKIEEIMKKNNCKDIEIDIMCDTVEHLYKLYGNQLNDLQILVNVARIEKIETEDLNKKTDYSGYMTRPDKNGRVKVVYKDFPDEKDIRDVLTHEFMHVLSNKVYENGVSSGIQSHGKEDFRALNESLTESFARNVLKSQGIESDYGTNVYYDMNDQVQYVYEKTSNYYSRIAPYGDILIDINKDYFVKNYFVSIDENFHEKTSDFSISMYNVVFEDFKEVKKLAQGKIDNRYSDEYDKLNKDFCRLIISDNDFTSQESGFLSRILKSDDGTKKYFELMDKIEGLPGMSQENISYLDYNKFSNRSKVNIDDYLNKDSNFNQSLEIVKVIRENFKDSEIDIQKIKFVEIYNEKDNSKEIVFFIGDGKKYLFNRDAFEINDFSLSEYKGSLDLNQDLFYSKSFNIAFSEKVDSSKYDFKELIKICDKSNWLDKINNNFDKNGSAAFKFISGESFTIQDFLDAKNFKDVNNNNIMHLFACKNYSNKSIEGSFSNFFQNIDLDKLDFSKNIKLKEMFTKLLTEKNSEGLTPFDEAIKNNNKESIIFLSKIIDKCSIKEFTSGSVYVEGDSYFNNILDKAIKNKDYSVAVNMTKALKNDVDFNSCLKIAVDKEIVDNQFWNKVDVNDVNHKDDKNGNLLNYATSKKEVNYDVIESILNKKGVDVNLVDFKNKTPLHNMLLQTSDEKHVIIKKLIDKGADVNAEYNLNDKIIKKSTGLPLTEEDYMFSPIKGKILKLKENEIERFPSTATALQIASGIVDSKYKDYDSINILVKSDADITKGTENLVSPLEAAHIDGDVKMFKIFVENGYSTKELFDGYDNSKLTDVQKDSLEKYEKSILNIRDKEDRNTENNFSNFFKIYKDKEDSVFDKFNNLFSKEEKIEKESVNDFKEYLQDLKIKNDEVDLDM